MSDRKEIIHGISATRASAILGMNKWKTPLLAWQEIMEKLKPGFNAEHGFIMPPREDKPVFRWGHAFESAVIELAEHAGSDEITCREALVKDEGNPPAFGYIDGMYHSMSHGMKIHEGKITFERAYHKNWGEPGTDRVPSHVQVQVQHCMMCAEADLTNVSVLVYPKPAEEFEEMGWEVIKKDTLSGEVEYLFRNETRLEDVKPSQWADTLAEMGYFHQYNVPAKPDSHKLLREVYNDFWHRYVLTEKPPEVTDYEDIRRIFPAPKGSLVVDDDMAEVLREYKNIGKEIGSGGFLKKRQVDLKTKILDFAKDKTTVADDDSQERIVFLDDCGNKLGQFDGKAFRV